jgi:hypothetical protein
VSRRWKLRLAVPAFILLVAVGMLAASHPGDWAFGIGWGLFGVVGVIGCAYIFLALGEAEDRDRARELRERERRRRGHP